MELNQSISTNMLSFIDASYVYVIPILIAYLAKDFIGGFIIWSKMRISDKGYYSTNSWVLWDGQWQMISKISFTEVELKYQDNSKLVESSSKIKVILKKDDYTDEDKRAIQESLDGIIDHLSQDNYIITTIPIKTYFTGKKVFKN